MNPEDSVVDAIGELVDASLDAQNQDDYHALFREQCPLCAREWHGLPMDTTYYGDPNALVCPGAFATDEQASEYRQKNPLFSTSREPTATITVLDPQDWWPLGYLR